MKKKESMSIVVVKESLKQVQKSNHIKIFREYNKNK
jgi:hypothetical protein